nr:hypothetical protein [uncultured Bilophila sp.]
MRLQEPKNGRYMGIAPEANPLFFAVEPILEAPPFAAGWRHLNNPIGIVYLVDFLSGRGGLDADICQGRQGTSQGTSAYCSHCCPKKM